MKVFELYLQTFLVFFEHEASLSVVSVPVQLNDQRTVIQFQFTLLKYKNTQKILLNK